MPSPMAWKNLLDCSQKQPKRQEEYKGQKPKSEDLIVNIDPWKKSPPSREQELDIETPEVADIFFRLAFRARKLDVVNEFNSQSFSDYITNRATHPDLFQELVVEPPERFYIADRIKGFRCPSLVTSCQRDLYRAAVAKSRLGCPVVVLVKSPVLVPPKVEDVYLPCLRHEHPDAPNGTNLKTVRRVVVVGGCEEHTGPELQPAARGLRAVRPVGKARPRYADRS